MLGLWAGWLAGSMVMFVYSAVAGATWPSSWQAPWSGATDFVVMEGGRLAVYISDFDRVQLYSSKGVFEGSLVRAKGYVSGETRLSLATDGRLFVTASHGRLRSYSPEGRLLDERSDGVGFRGWQLGADGEPVALDQPSGGERTEAVEPGEVLFAGYPAPKRSEFVGAEGRRATSAGSTIVLGGNDGSEVKVGTPWYLVPVKYPWPGSAPWIVLIVVSAIDRLRTRMWSSAPGKRES